MANFSRQPILPPHHPASSAAADVGGVEIRRPGSPPPSAPTLAHFAILGYDHQTGENISTVIEARSEDEAQEMALRLGITVHEFKPMHPLAGAAAAAMARRDPADRFNQPADSPAHSLPRRGKNKLRLNLAAGPGAIPKAGALPGAGVIPGAGAGAGRESVSHNRAGGLAVLGVLTLVAGLLWVTVLRGGGAQQVLAMIAPPPPPTPAAFDVTEPLGVDLSGIAGFEDWTPDKAIHQIKSPDDGRLRLEATVPPSAAAKRAGLGGSAVIGGRILTPGHTIAGHRLLQVRDGVVILQKDGKLIALRMSDRSD